MLHKLRFLSLTVPFLFGFIIYNTGDYFYYFPLIVSFLLGALVIFPSFLSNINFRNNKKERSNKAAFRTFVPTGTRSTKVHILQIPIYIVMLVWILVSAGVSYFAIFNLPNASGGSVFFAFYQSIRIYAQSQWLPILLGFLGIFGVLFIFHLIFNNRAIRSYPGYAFKSILISLLLILLSTLVAYLTMYGYGLAQYGLQSKALSENKLSSRILIKTDKITSHIKELKSPPELVLTEKEMAPTIVYYLVYSKVNKSTFYASTILTHLPSSLIYPAKPISSPLVLVDHTLFIQSLEKNDIEQLSPILGKQLVKDYFKERFIKDEPSITILGRQEYLRFREDQINEQIKKIQELVDQVQKNIATVNSNIQSAKNRIATAQSGINNASSLLASDYKICTTEMGYDVDGNYVRWYPDSYCAEIKAYYEGIIAGLQKTLADAQKQLQYQQGQLAQYSEAKKTLETIRSFVESQKQSTPQELGVFLPEKEIKLALDSTDKKTVSTYAVTLVHEYLHYTSFVSQERSLPRFFEEGLTEYYARKVISQSLKKDTNVGYPLIVKLINQMASKLPAKELEDIYFTKNTEGLISLLDRVYGKDFYADSEFYFTAMSYVSSRDALKFANNIMFKIDGPELDEKDLYSDIQ